MQPFWFLLGMLIFICVVGGMIVTRRRQIRRLRDLAQRHRLNYSAEDLIGIHERYHNLETIRQGHSRHACHLIFGSTDVGMVTLFCYTFDLGFGINRSSQQWWITVVETTGQHDHWRARPVDSEKTDADGERIDRFSLRADRHNTIALLREAGIEQLFQDAPADYHWEIRGPLVAVTSSGNTDPHSLDRLLTTACNLAHLLAGTAET